MALAKSLVRPDPQTVRVIAAAAGGAVEPRTVVGYYLGRQTRPATVEIIRQALGRLGMPDPRPSDVRLVLP